MFRYLGKKFLSLIAYLGSVGVLFSHALGLSFLPPFRKKNLLGQMTKIGVESLPLVFLTSLFTGMVLALQSAYQMQKIGARIYISSLVALSITRELGPVLTALVVAGRMGAAIAAELGTMKVTEQIDALQTLAVNPIKHLVVPRFIALMSMLPILTIYADLVGILGGFIIGVGKLGIGKNLYLRMTFNTLTYKDVFTGVVKAFSFAIIIALISCREGLDTEGGAEGVGRATTRAVVFSFILIIAADCLFTALFYFMFK
ncbi:MAG: ABC transporter permease [Candidatus Omnitrophica bacterium]|nr:ABC transporter permease [Candidatus Omnitrophota bacterium]